MRVSIAEAVLPVQSMQSMQHGAHSRVADSLPNWHTLCPAASVRFRFFQHLLQDAQLAVDRTNLEAQNLRDQWIKMNTFERCNGLPGADVRTGGIEDRFHRRHRARIVSVCAAIG